MIHVEATEVDPLVTAVLLRHKAQPVARLEPDILGGAFRVFNMRATARAVYELADLLVRNPSLKWGHHIKIYSEDVVLVHWHDADTAWPLLLSSQFTQAEVSRLERDLGCAFQLAE